MEPTQITPEIAKKLGYDSVEALMAVAKEVDEQSDGLGKITGELSKAVEAFTAATKEYTETKRIEMEEAQFEELCKDKLVEVVKGLPVNDPRRIEIESEFVNKFGEHMTSTVLGDEYVKALQAPTSKTNPKYDERLEVRKAHDNMLLLTAYNNGLFPGGGNDQVEFNLRTAMKSAKLLEKAGMAGAPAVIKAIEKAMDTQTTAEGIEWLPRNLSASMWEDLYLNLQLPALFRHIPLTSKTMDVPIRLGRARSYIVDEVLTDTTVGSATPYFSNQVTASGMRTGKIAFTARKLGCAIWMSDELDEDSLLPILSMLREEVIYGMSDGLEDAILNGSSSVSDLDNANTDTNRLWNNTADAGDGIRLNTGTRDARNLWDGLRKDFVTSSAGYTSGSTFDLTALRNARKVMGKYGVNPQDLVWIISPNSHIDILKFAEVVTLEKYGPGATVLQGEIGRIDGIPIIISPRVYTNLNASGVYDHVTETKTVAVCAHRLAYGFGDRRLMRVESDRQALAGQRYVLATWRGDFKKMFAAAEPVVSVINNIAK